MPAAPIIACDVSSWQRPVDDRYPHQWFIFRCCDGSYADPVCMVNKTWAERALREGRILGWTAYVVYRPSKVAAILAEVAKLPAGGHVMIDVESWGGAIRGDHSDEINQLARGLQKLFPGQLIPGLGLGRVWRYGNSSDLAAIHPGNTLNLPTFVAAYGTVKPTDPNLIGWQYTDGSDRWPVPAGFPRSSAPFGPCDHNVLYLPTATAGDSMSAAEVDEIKAAITAQSAADRAWFQNYVDAKLGGTINREVADASASAAALKVLTDPAGVLARITDLQKTVTVSAGSSVPAEAYLAAITEAARAGAAAGIDGATINATGGNL